MKKTVLLGLLAGLLAFCVFPLCSSAATMSVTVDAFDGPANGSGFPYSFDLPDFNFDLNGETIVSATITGIWGQTNVYSGSTAHNEVWLDGIKVADTRNAAVDPFYNIVPWSYSYSDFSTLIDGYLDYSVVQTSEWYVRLGATTLTIETAPVPIPAAIWILGSGLIGLAGLARRKKIRA